jgi:hypothetical protein
MFKLKNQNRVDRDSIENNVSKVARRVKGLLLIGISVTAFSGLTACGGGDSSPAVSSGATTCTDIAGEPDMMGQITYTPSTVALGDPVTMHIPIDGETAFVGAQLTGLSGGNSTPTLVSGTGYVTVTPLGTQTIDVPMTIDAAGAAGSYVPVINVCTADLGACKQVDLSAGVAVSYAFSSLAAPLLRFKYFSGGAAIAPGPGNFGTNSCVATPVLTVTP